MYLPRNVAGHKVSTEIALNLGPSSSGGHLVEVSWE